MAGATAGLIVLGLAVGLGVQAAHGGRVVDPASARQATTSPAIKAIGSELAALAADGRATDLAARLDVIANDRALDAVAQEWLIDRGLHALSTLSPTARARDTVLRLTRRGPVVYIHLDPDHGERATPLYDAGATARFVLKRWERNAARNAVQAELRAGSTGVVGRLAARGGTHESDPVRAGIADAFRAASTRELRAQREPVAQAMAQGRRVDEPALILAERLADAALFRLVFGHADAPVALAAISNVVRTLDPQTAFGELALATRRAEIASAAVLAIGRLAQVDATARQFLFEAIVEPDIGPSAAAALAGVDDPGIAAELARRLAAAKTEESRRLLVLALRLDASDSARAALDRFAQSGDGSTELRKEVRQWLTR